MKSNTGPDADMARTLELDLPQGTGKRLKRWGALVLTVDRNPDRGPILEDLGQVRHPAV